MTDKQQQSTSATIQSYVDSAVATGQSVLGSLTGNNNNNNNTTDKVSLSFLSVWSFTSSLSSSSSPLLYLLTYNQKPTPKTHPSTSQPHSSSDKNDSSITKVGPIAASPSGGIATDSPLRTEGSYNQTVGAAKEALGGLVGADGLKREGQQQNAEGKGQEAEGQVRDYGQGVQDRIGGAVGGIVKGLKGDKEGETAERLRHDDGKTAQRSAERDILRDNQ